MRERKRGLGDRGALELTILFLSTFYCIELTEFNRRRPEIRRFVARSIPWALDPTHMLV